MYIPLTHLILGGLVILAAFWLLLRRRDGARDLVAPPPSRPAAAPIGPATTPAGSTEAEIRALVARGRKIEAIKRAREAWQLGLAEAKDLVEAIEAGAPVALSDAPAPAAAARLDEEIQRLLAADRKIEAIKRAREALGLGLAEAKDYVEARERG